MRTAIDLDRLPTIDPRSLGERNDFLQSSVGPDRSNRPADVVTAARNLTELGYLDRFDAALTGKRTQALDDATKEFQLEQNKKNNNLTIDGPYGPATQAAILPALQTARRQRSISNP